MGDFADGFVTGFANTLADGINERNKIARDYFQKQYEIATTVGLANHRKISSQVEVSVKTAKQLQQMGVPTDIIMAVASQDPLGLNDFYEQIVAAQKSGVPIDENFFREFVTISEDFKAPDEDFSTFFRKALTPITAHASADPEGFNRDRKGGIFGALMGADPYGRAQERLENTIVIDGLSASELASYGQDYQPTGVDNAPTVSYNYGALKGEKSSELSVSETTAINREIDELAKQIRDAALLEGLDMTPEAAREAAIGQVRERYSHLPEVVAYLGGTPEESAITTESLPPTAEELEAAGIGSGEPIAVEEPEGASTVATLPEAITPAEEPPAPAPAPPAAPTGVYNPIDPERENLYNITIKGLSLTWYSNNDDGTVTYLDSNGEEYIFDPAEVRQFVQQFGNNYE